MSTVQLPLNAETLFYDDFEDGKIGDVYVLDAPQTLPGKPNWVEEGGVLKQTEPRPGDECYAIIAEDIEFPELITIQAKVRVDSWENGDGARCGVGLRLNPDTGRGLSLLFHNTQNQLQFLSDQASWGNQTAVDGEVGKWYWFKFYVDEKDDLLGKAWADGEDEPKDWMLEQNIAFTAADRTIAGGYQFPALNACGTDAARAGTNTVSFDEVEVYDEGGPSPKAVNAQGKLAATWGGLKR
jgi:hypothetical protein